jgi:hypothetical protein
MWDKRQAWQFLRKQKKAACSAVAPSHLIGDAMRAIGIGVWNRAKTKLQVKSI